MIDPIHRPDLDPKADPNEERELRAVSALLRGLPDPEAPDGLAERVMSAVAERESRPNVIRAAFGRVGEHAVASALAAGIGCLLLAGAFQGGLLQGNGPTQTRLEPTQAHRVGNVTSTQLERRGGPSLSPRMVIDPQAAGFFATAAPQGLLAPPTPTRLEAAGVLDPRLDHQLNGLLLDPAAFYSRLERLREPKKFVARLADRAARRGDAVDLALKLRQSSPDREETSWLVDQLLRAALARRIGQ